MNLDILYYSLDIIRVDHPEIINLIKYDYNTFDEKTLKNSPIFSINKILKKYYLSYDLEESDKILEKLNKTISISNYWISKKISK
jgi:hypothetical protein